MALNVLTAGEGPAMLLLHGFTGSARSWSASSSTVRALRRSAFCTRTSSRACSNLVTSVLTTVTLSRRRLHSLLQKRCLPGFRSLTKSP